MQASDTVELYQMHRASQSRQHCSELISARISSAMDEGGSAYKYGGFISIRYMSFTENKTSNAVPE